MQQNQPRPALLAIGTAVPRYKRSQAEVGQWMSDSFGDCRRTGRLVRTLHHYSGIQTRYACTPHYHLPASESRLAPGAPPARSATTAERMQIYEQESVPLGLAAARQALARYAAASGQTLEAVAGSITHLIVVSCTGFFAPGLDFMLAHKLGLPLTARRTLIGFMGCAAAFNGLRSAMEIVMGQPQARVLVVSVELCSLHCQPSDDDDSLVGASIFSDGAAAGLVGLPAPGAGDFFRLDGFYTAIQPETQGEMVWQIRDHGFTLRLSAQIPEHLAQAAPPALQTLFDSRRPQFWALHPGGRAIIDRLAEIFALDAADLQATRRILADYGNMSSATILFVLDALRRQITAEHAGSEKPSGVAMAFGPGLVIEMSRLTYVPLPARRPDGRLQAAAGSSQASAGHNGRQVGPRRSV